MSNAKIFNMGAAKYTLVFWSVICPVTLKGQADTAFINKTIEYAGNLDTDKTDSILYYSCYINEISYKIDYPYGVAMAKRYCGRYYEYYENFDSAIIEYNDFARLAEKSLSKLQQMIAIADIAAVYMRTEQYELAKENYITCLSLATKAEPSQRALSQLNNNLAGTYQYLHDYDSAFFYYQQAIKIDELLKDSLHLAERKSNISEILIPMGKIELARKYLLESTEYNERHNMTDALWYDYSNLGNLSLLLKDYKKSENYYALSYLQANKTSTKTKLAQTLEGFSKLFQALGQYQKALQYKIQSDSINSLLINENTNEKIAELQEKYQSQKREQQNIILIAELDKQILQRRNTSIFAFALFFIAIICSIAWYLNHRKKNQVAAQNRLINTQNNRLVELNHEKNSLISIVGHDLQSPIVNLYLRAKMLAKNSHTANGEVNGGLEEIVESADYCIDLIDRILTVEKQEIGNHKIKLEQVNLCHYVGEIVSLFQPISELKRITILNQSEQKDIIMMTDRLLLKRVIENLLSNAIKFSPAETKVWVELNQLEKNIRISVKDEGPGIEEAEKKLLFRKYGRSKNLPTGNETSTGLGLYIVKRVTDELGAKIRLASTPGKGACFEILFPI